MKVLLLIPALRKGGSERFVSNLSLMLSAEHQVKVAIFDNIVEFPLGGELCDLKTPTKESKLGKIFTVFKRCIKLRRLVKNFKPDVIVSVMKAANRINTMCSFKGVRQFISCRGFAELKLIPDVFLKGALKTDGIIFNSKEARDYFCKEYGCPENKAFYSYNIIDMKKISQGIEEPIDDKTLEHFLNTHKCVANLGRLSAVKCQIPLVKAFEVLHEKVPESGLVIIGGDGNVADELKKRVSESPCRESIFLTGNRDNPYNVLSRCNVYALSSMAEGFPNALVEAMFCDLPAVATDCMTGPGEILRARTDVDKTDEVEIASYGILTPDIEGRETDFAKALELVLTDGELHDKLKNKAKERSLEFTPAQAFENFMEIISGRVNA
ncbi:MAG: glycosyltransferase [Ruminococcaceae bacterium]|nr:glycosyltransferase [Oscillospiraceae bacterium]